MTLPRVTITELTRALGALPPSSNLPMAIVAPADNGPLNTPGAYSRSEDVEADFVGGHLVQLAAYHIANYGGPVVVCRSAATTVGATSSLVAAVTGTSVPTLDAGTPPNGYYEGKVRFVTGGTIGIAGITYQESLDGGRTLTPVKALGTATHLVLAESGGAQVNLAAGTIAAGDALTFVAKPNLFSAAELGDALDALSRTSLPWQFVQVGGEMSATTLAMLDTKLSGMKAIGKERWGIAHTRMPLPGESNSTYRTSIVGVFGAVTSTLVALGAGACKTLSGLDGREYRWPNTIAVASKHASVSAEINVAAKDVGVLKGVRIVDDNGNPDDYDERLDGGLDDARFLVLRTWEGDSGTEPGAFVNIPRMFSSPGDDVRLIPHRRVLNLFNAALRTYFQNRLSKPTLVDKTTGFLLEQEAVEMEKAAVKACRTVLAAKPMVSAIKVVVSRTDDLLHTTDPHISVTGSIVPLVYPQGFDITTGFIASASNVVAA